MMRAPRPPARTVQEFEGRFHADLEIEVMRERATFAIGSSIPYWALRPYVERFPPDYGVDMWRVGQRIDNIDLGEDLLGNDAPLEETMVVRYLCSVSRGRCWLYLMSQRTRRERAADWLREWWLGKNGRYYALRNRLRAGWRWSLWKVGLGPEPEAGWPIFTGLKIEPRIKPRADDLAAPALTARDLDAPATGLTRTVTPLVKMVRINAWPNQGAADTPQ